MSTLGRGTLLADRYRLEQRLSESEASSLWRGVDTTLDRQVAIRIISPRTAGEALDAARRAALVDDPRLVRLLDVAHAPSPIGGTATQTYVVSEWIDGKSLADLLDESGPLPAERVRMLVGEAAEALAAAATRGLHHLALDPTSVLLTGDGAVRVHGLAVTAAAHGGAQPDGAAAERVDAVGLVSLIYAGLTGRWPLPTNSHDDPLDTAPMVGNSPVSPGEIATGIPNDLDTLCAVTFGQGDDGPTSPADLAAQLKPWGSPNFAPATNRLLAEDLRQAPRRTPRRFPIQLTPVQGQDTIPPAPRRTTTADLFGGVAGAPAAAAPTASGDDWEPPSQLVDRRPADENDPPHAGESSRTASGGDGGRGATTRAKDASEPRRTVRWQPILVVAALVVVGLVLAVWSLSRSTDSDSPNPAPATQTATTEPATPGTPPKIAEVTAFDPEGGDGENDAQAARAMDGDPATTWGSSRYNSASFGNLKGGVGLVVRLESPATVEKVTVSVEGAGGAVEIRTATGPTLDGSQVVASGPAGGTLEKTLDPAPQSQYLIIWFTELPQVDGQYRAVVAEVGVA